MKSNNRPIDPNCLGDPQAKLSKALINRDLNEFRLALQLGGNALLSDDRHINIFEKALQTPGCSEFIRECLNVGCDPNHVNTFYNKAAINFASDSRDPENLREILLSPGVRVDHKYSDLSPLNSLAKNLTNDNVEDVIECMRILLRYGASANVPDQREMTPLHNLIMNRRVKDARKYEIIQMFLALNDIDIDTYRNGELRTILEKDYPLMELPQKKNDKLITFHSLLTAMRNGDISAFEQQFNNEYRNVSKDEELELLLVSIETGVEKVFDIILNSGIDCSQTVRSNKNTPLEISCIYGNWFALEKLLQRPEVKLRPKDNPLSFIVRKLNQNSVLDFCNYWKCFYILLDSDKININAKDLSSSTALHYAVRYRNNKAVRELLKRGACISLENGFHELPLYGMSPAVWEEHLDDCITCSEDKLGDKTFEIIVNFKNFIYNQANRPKNQLNAVLTPIAFMAKSKEYRYLLQHPVITSILYLKWHKLSLVFYVNFILYIFFAISMTTHAVLKYRVVNHALAEHWSLCCSILGIIYLILRELLQLILSPIMYLRSLTNYLEIALIVLSIITCYKFTDKHLLEIQLNLAVACILFLAYELAILVGSLPISSISTHMLMLKAVCKSFLKGFLLYSIFIFTFTLCFYIKSSSDVSKDDDEYFHKFADPLVAFAKTMVMFTGEFDAGSLKLDSYTYVLFLSFVFFMTIILFNLLNGLAVSDTQAIKDQAELNDIICRTDVLYRYEKALYEQTVNFSYLLNSTPVKLLSKRVSKLFPDYTTDIQISILPNDKNKVTGPKNLRKFAIVAKKFEEKIKNEETCTIPLADNADDTDEEENGDADGMRNFLKCWFSWFNNQCSRIDNRTVRNAMKILEKKSSQSIEQRLEIMEEKLNKIIKSLDIQDENESLCI